MMMSIKNEQPFEMRNEKGLEYYTDVICAPPSSMHYNNTASICQGMIDHAKMVRMAQVQVFKKF